MTLAWVRLLDLDLKKYNFSRYIRPRQYQNARYQTVLDEVRTNNKLERSTVKSATVPTNAIPTTTTEEPEYEYYYEYIYEEDLPEFQENLPPSTTFETETTLPTKQTILESTSKLSEPPLTASNGKLI